MTPQQPELYQFTESDFLEAMELLDEENKKEVLENLEDARQKMAEAYVTYQSVNSYLKIVLNQKRQQNGKEKTGTKTNAESNGTSRSDNRLGTMETDLQDTVQFVNMDGTTEGNGGQQSTIGDETQSVNDSDTDNGEVC